MTLTFTYIANTFSGNKCQLEEQLFINVCMFIRIVIIDYMYNVAKVTNSNLISNQQKFSCLWNYIYISFKT